MINVTITARNHSYEKGMSCFPFISLSGFLHVFCKFHHNNDEKGNNFGTQQACGEDPLRYRAKNFQKGIKREPKRSVREYSGT